MTNLKLFIKRLAELGLELSESKYTEGSFSYRQEYSCNIKNQVSVFVQCNVSSNFAFCSLSTSLSNLLKPIDKNPPNWEDMSESQVSSFAQEYFDAYSSLTERAICLTKDF